MEMSTDITEIKLLQNQLKESQEKYRMLFEEVPCFISIQDRDLRIVEANRLHREAFGTSYGSKCYEVYKHRSTECQPCIVRQTFESGEVYTHEEVVTSQDNKQMNVIVVTAPLKNADGELDKVVEMSVDITQIRELQDKLASVGMLIGTISHGIKGLLNSLDGGIYLVNSGLQKDDRSRIDQGWEIASRNIRRIRSMVMDILYYAKDREPDWETLAVNEIVDEVCGLFSDRAKRQNITFNCSINSDAGQFEADRQAVRALLLNILDNSLDACRIDKKKMDHTISLEVNGKPDHIIFEVSDNGIGMDRETREKALSLFFSSKGAGGTGLGLFIANKIAQSHGGQIEVQSEEGEGSTFIVTMLRKRP
jgi:PAS domain S-box-containing protein